MNELARVARKIGLGFRPEDDLSLSPRDWVEEQLTHPPSNLALVSLEAPRRELADWPADLTYDLGARIVLTQVKRRKEVEIDETASSEAERVRLTEELHKATDLRHIDVCRFTQRASWGSDQVRQRLTHFWLNHFTVGAKDQTPTLIGDFWDMIAGALDGSFSDLAYRATTHPAMLSYLDNTNNVGPRSRHGLGCNCGDGLNDNLARELMELHTVSPARGYSETDIREAAKVLSGWGDIFELEQNWNPPPADWSQAWVRDRAEPGEKTVLGITIPAGREGLRTLVDALAVDEHTRLFISAKLARHFIGESADDADIAAIVAAWESSGGHLPTIHREVLLRAIASPRPRFHWPQTWLFQMIRISGASIFAGYADAGKYLMRAGAHHPTDILRELGNSFWMERQPNGFSDRKADWVSTEHMDRRYRFASLIAAFGEPTLSVDEIIEREGLSAATRELVRGGTTEIERFVLLACSREMMET